MANTVTEQVLEAQAFGYAVCAVQSNAKAIDDSLYGECGCEDDCRAMFYQWGVEIMNTTKADDCDCDDKCVTAEFACNAIKLLNPGCIVCGCGNPDDVPFDCAITQDATVYQALDADQQTVVPNVAGRTTLVISDLTDAGNDWADHVGQIATDDGAGTFTWYLPPTATVVLASATGVYYVTYPGGAGPLYPPIDGSQNFTTLILLSRFPSITLMYGRTVVVEVSQDGVTWTPIYSGPETSLAYGVTLTLADGYLPVQTRTTYYYGPEDECSFAYANGSIPPFVPPPCGVLVYSVTPESTCGTDNWTIDVAFTQIDGWGIGDITPTVNGVPGTSVGITLGTLTFGPYIMGDLVTFDLTSNLDAACDITTQTYADPRVGEQDYTVTQAVDANQYAALSGDGNDYYIVSNVDNLVADWGLHVGEIWLGASSTYTNPANLEIVYASTPGGSLGFWQDDSGTPRQMFPQPTFTQNTVTLVWVAELPELPPFTEAWATLFIQAQCPSSSVVVHTGTPSSFTSPSVFAAPACAFASVTGFAAYSNGCAVRVPAILEQYTPTGDPDPGFVGGGLDNIVRDLADSRQGDGSFIVVGSFSHYDPTPGANIVANCVTKLNTDGTLNTAFNNNVNGAGPSPGFDNRVDAVQVTAAGKIYVAGYFTTLNNVSANRIVRLNADGTRDNTFNIGTGFNNVVIDIELQSDEKLLVSGVFTDYNGTACTRLVRLNTNGTIDNTFLPVLNGTGGHLSIAPNGTIVMNSGTYGNYNGVPVLTAPADGTAIRINPDSSLNSIIAQGAQFEWSVPPTSNEVQVMSDGSVLFAGSFTDYDSTTVNRIVKLRPLGAIDGTFLTNTGTGYTDQTHSVDEFPNGQIMVGSVASADLNGSPSLGLVRLNADGSRDATWDIGTGFNTSVYVVRVDTFGDLLVGGAFTSLDGTTYNRVVKLA